jgi:hypothetical protein
MRLECICDLVGCAAGSALGVSGQMVCSFSFQIAQRLVEDEVRLRNCRLRYVPNQGPG